MATTNADLARELRQASPTLFAGMQKALVALEKGRGDPDDIVRKLASMSDSAGRGIWGRKVNAKALSDTLLFSRDFSLAFPNWRAEYALLWRCLWSLRRDEGNLSEDAIALGGLEARMLGAIKDLYGWDRAFKIVGLSDPVWALLVQLQDLRNAALCGMELTKSDLQSIGVLAKRVLSICEQLQRPTAKVVLDMISEGSLSNPRGRITPAEIEFFSDLASGS